MHPGGLRRAPLQQIALALVAGEVGRGFESQTRLLKPAEFLQEIAADARQEVIGFQRRFIRKSLDDGEPGLRTFGHADRHRAVEFDDRRPHQRREVRVER